MTVNDGDKVPYSKLIERNLGCKLLYCIDGVIVDETEYYRGI